MKKTITSKQLTVTLHILFWSVSLLLPYFVSTAANQYKIGPIPGLFFTIAGFIHMVIFYGNAFYLYPKLLNKRYWWLYLLSVAALIVGSFMLKFRILAAWFPEVLKDMSAYKFIFAPSIGVFIISMIYRKVVDKIQHEKEQKEKRAIQLATELKFLRSQISPHFLFNVLTNLVSLARKQSKQLEASLIMLSDLMRYMLYDSQGEKVLLGKEVTYLNSYIELQRLRFGSDVSISSELKLDETASQLMIEPMLLIPFVENAFKHGVNHMEHPQIQIHLTFEDDTVHFEVSNDFEADKSKDENSGIGLANVQSRLQLLYPGKHTLTVEDRNNLFHITLTLTLA